MRISDNCSAQLVWLKGPLWTTKKLHTDILKVSIKRFSKFCTHVVMPLQPHSCPLCMNKKIVLPLQKLGKDKCHGKAVTSLPFILHLNYTTHPWEMQINSWSPKSTKAELSISIARIKIHPEQTEVSAGVSCSWSPGCGFLGESHTHSHTSTLQS